MRPYVKNLMHYFTYRQSRWFEIMLLCSSYCEQTPVFCHSIYLQRLRVCSRLHPKSEIQKSNTEIKVHSVIITKIKLWLKPSQWMTALFPAAFAASWIMLAEGSKLVKISKHGTVNSYIYSNICLLALFCHHILRKHQQSSTQYRPDIKTGIALNKVIFDFSLITQPCMQPCNL